MKSFLLKYKGRIIFWIVFSFVVLYFAPRQHDYYLDEDVDNFKRIYLIPILIWTVALASIISLTYILVTTKSIKQSGLAFLSVGVTLAFYAIIFQNLFLGTFLFLNRLYKKEILQKAYVVGYMVGTDKTKDNFVPYDLSAMHVSIDARLINRIYNTGLKQNDTVTLQFDKGLFGILFQSRPFKDQ